MDILPNEPLRNSTPAYLIDHSLPPLPTVSHGMSSTSPLPVGIHAQEQILSALPVPAHLPQSPLPTFTSPSTGPSQDLTEEQIGRIGSMVQRLLRQRVPIPVVATVMEGMLSEEGADGPSTSGDRSRVGAIEHTEMAAPPSNNFK